MHLNFEMECEVSSVLILYHVSLLRLCMESDFVIEKLRGYYCFRASCLIDADSKLLTYYIQLSSILFGLCLYPL